MSGLGSRVAVAIPLAVIAIYAVLVGGWLMTLLAILAGVIAVHEYTGMTRELRPLAIAGFAGVAGVIAAVHEGGVAWGVAPLLLTMVLAFWLSAVADVRQSAAVQMAATVFGVLWIGFGLATLVALRDIALPEDWGQTLVLAVLAGVWANDIAAYAAGRMLGTHKLAPVISPKKTIEGLVAGVLVGTAAAFVVLYDQPGVKDAAGDAFLIALAVAVAGPLGDLFESYLKRDAQIKDSSSILAGHGGVLDRIDALLFAGPVAYFVVLALGRT